MKSQRISLLCLLVAVCVAGGAWLGSHPARAENDLPAAPVLPGRYQQLTTHKDAAADDLQILDTATGKLYSLQKRAKPKDKEATYEWVLIAEGPK